MPRIGVLLLFIGVIAWLNGLLSASVFWTLIILYILWDIVGSSLPFKFGYVSKEKYNSTYKDYKIYRDNFEALQQIHDELEFRVENEFIHTDELKSIKRRERIVGQTAVFELYLSDPARFMKTLNEDYRVDYERKQYQKRQRQNNSKVNKKQTNWRLTLGVNKDADYTTVRTVYYKLCKQFHPDVPGGSEEKMKEINAAWSEAEAYFGK